MRKPRVLRARPLRIVLAVVSTGVFLVCGAGWVGTAQLARALHRSGVVDAPASTTGEQNILLVGLDSRTDAQGRPLPADVLAALHAGQASDGGDNTDTMIVVHLPADGSAATGYSLPRDSYVPIADGFGTHKINSAYAYGANAARAQLAAQGVGGAPVEVHADAAGARTAIATVESLTGLHIDHYAAITLAGFYDISQAVGGIPVCLVAPIQDAFSGADFPAGRQSVAGAAALAFVRQRHGLPGGDLDRVRRQQVFLASMAHTVLSEHTLTDPARLAALDDALRRAVVVDSTWDVLGMAGRLGSMEAGAVSFRTIPVTTAALPTTTDGVAVGVDPAAVAAFIAATDVSANPPTAFPTPTPAPAPAPEGAAATIPATGAAATAPVDVRNASLVEGATTVAMSALAAHGVIRGSTSDAPAQPSSRILYPRGDRATAQRIDTALGGGFTLREQRGTNRITVVLGTDQRPVSTDPTGAPPAPVITGDAVPCVN